MHLGWPLVIGALLLGPLSGLFTLPQWITDVAPFTHDALVPVAPMSWPPMLVMLCLSAGFVALGGWAYRHRDSG